MIYALDSNIVSYILKDDAKVIALYRKALSEGDDIVIPPIVFYEVQRGLLAANLSKRLTKFDVFCRKTRQPGFHPSVWRKASQIYATLYRQRNLIDDADIFIAAYCLVNDFTLVTNNTRHFDRIDGLRLVNWKN